MKHLIAAVFALALFVPGCSDWSSSGPDSPLDVSGVWEYEGKATRSDCNPEFCRECHGKSASDVEPYKNISGTRIIEQDEVECEKLTISDHIITYAMKTTLSGTLKVYSGDFICGAKQVDQSGTAIHISDCGTFHSDKRYTSTLALWSSKDDTVICKVIWKITGTKSN